MRWQLEQLGDRVGGAASAPDAALRAARARPAASALEDARGEPVRSESEPTRRGERVLYRCRTPTNFLCPCGAVARRLSRHGLEHRTERVALRKRDRPEIVELTRQRRVPVLVDGDEVDQRLAANPPVPGLEVRRAE